MRGRLTPTSNQSCPPPPPLNTSSTTLSSVSTAITTTTTPNITNNGGCIQPLWFDSPPTSRLPLHSDLVSPGLLLPVAIERGGLQSPSIVHESIPSHTLISTPEVGSPYLGAAEDINLSVTQTTDHAQHCQHLYNNASFYNNDLAKSVGGPPVALLGHLPWKLYDNSQHENNSKMWLQDFNAQSSSNCHGVGYQGFQGLQLPSLPHIPSPSHPNTYHHHHYHHHHHHHHHSRVAYTQALTREEDTSWFELSWRRSPSSFLEDPGGGVFGYEGTCSLHSVTTSLHANCSPVLSYSPPPPQMMIGCGTSASLFYMGPTASELQGAQPPPLAVVTGQCRECSVGCMDWTTCGCRFLPGGGNAGGCFFTLCGATERLAHLFTGLFAS